MRCGNKIFLVLSMLTIAICSSCDTLHQELSSVDSIVINNDSTNSLSIEDEISLSSHVTSSSSESITKKVKVTFDYGYEENGVEKIIQMEWDYNTKTKFPQPEPTREGYKFIGWYNENTNKRLRYEDSVCEETTYTAKWVVTHTVSFVENDGITVVQPSIQVCDGSVVPWPKNPEAPEGKYFKGWYQNKECTQIFSFDYKCIYEDTIIYCLFNPDVDYVGEYVGFVLNKTDMHNKNENCYNYCQTKINGDGLISKGPAYGKYIEEEGNGHVTLSDYFLWFPWNGTLVNDGNNHYVFITGTNEWDDDYVSNRMYFLVRKNNEEAISFMYTTLNETQNIYFVEVTEGDTKYLVLADTENDVVVVDAKLTNLDGESINFSNLYDDLTNKYLGELNVLDSTGKNIITYRNSID